MGTPPTMTQTEQRLAILDRAINLIVDTCTSADATADHVLAVAAKFEEFVIRPTGTTY